MQAISLRPLDAEEGEMGSTRHFRELDIYQLAMKTSMILFELSKAFPLEERYSLTDQVRRSSRSVCANIAEAWRKRRYPNALVSKLSDAEAEAAERRYGSSSRSKVAIWTPMMPISSINNTNSYKAS